jgi:predicted RNase H-like nuclease (RuvC/YqgF family)
MSDYPNDRDCQHGRLRRSCEICELERELAEANTSIEMMARELKQCRGNRMVQGASIAAVTDQRDEARKCLREAVDAVDAGTDYYKLSAMAHRWRKAAGMEAST